jgi:hypothetical protein
MRSAKPIATGDRGTIASVLVNHGKRIDSDLTMLIGLDGNVIADTFGDAAGTAFAHPGLLTSAESNHQASAMVMLSDRLYQVVLVPVLAPLPIAWVAIGYKVDDAVAGILRGPMRFHVSIFSRHAGGGWRLHASTLGAVERGQALQGCRGKPLCRLSIRSAMPRTTRSR